MKIKQILTIVCLLALVGGMQAKDYKYQTVPGDLTKTRIYTLDNGLKVYLSVNKDKPRIQTYIAVRTGSKNDPAGALPGAPDVQGHHEFWHQQCRR